jgi:K+-transporting ATPase ATPase A chain
MSAAGWFQIAIYCLSVAILTKPMGLYLFRVFEGDRRPLSRVFGPMERLLCTLCGTRGEEQDWKHYSVDLILFSVLGIVVLFVLQLAQGALPLNPQGFPAPSWHLALNTATSFVTNTNWQAYAGETTMSYLTQMVGLTWQNFVSAATGIAVALAFARGLTRRGAGATLGNFWVDVIRATLYVLLPISVVLALFFASQGVIQNFSPYVEGTTLEGEKQVIAMGPVASQEAIKLLGTNGGGFFNANSAHPFENPTPLVNFVQMLAIFAIPAGLTWTYGRMAGSQKQGWAIFSAMAVLFLAGVTATYFAEAGPNAAIPVAQRLGNLEGKEVRFGISATSLFATITTAASCGAVNGMHDSFTPLGGLIPMVNIQLGEVIFGGVGAGLYGMLVFSLLTIFVAGLMVGRTPEFLGKKIEAAEMKLVMIFLLVPPIFLLVLAGASSVSRLGKSSLLNAGPHGLSEILYAYSSGVGNNGSAFAGLNANTPWWNVTLAVAMFVGRFALIAAVLAIAGSLAGKKVVPPGPGTFPTDGALFAALLAAVVLIFGALTFFPALALGPVLEHFLAAAGKVS